MEIDELAGHANEFFVRKKRPDGTEFWTLKDDYPEWIRDMVYAVHADGNMLPDDYKYEYLVDVLDKIGEGWDPEEGSYDLEPDVYYSELIRWVGSHTERFGYVDEAVESLGWNKETGLSGAIQSGQVEEMRNVWDIVVDQLKERLEAIERDEPEIMHSEFEARERKKAGRRRRQDWTPER